MSEKTFYDPLFNKSDTSKLTVEASLAEAGIYGNPNAVMSSPISGKPMLKLLVGMHNKKAFPAWVSQEDRIVIPVIQA